MFITVIYIHVRLCILVNRGPWYSYDDGNNFPNISADSENVNRSEKEMHFGRNHLLEFDS